MGTQAESGASTPHGLEVCPRCGVRSSFWNDSLNLYECMNPDCRIRLTREDMSSLVSHPTALKMDEVVPDVSGLNRKVRALTAAVVLTSLVAVALAVGWFVSLSNASSRLESQKQETRKYAAQSENYLARLDQETGQLDAATSQLASTQRDLDTTRAQYTIVAASLTSAEAELSTANDQLQKTKSQLTLFQDTYGSVVASGVRPPFQGADLVAQPSAANPTWAQLQSFILADKTDQKPYIPDAYMCGDYAKDVYNNAEQAGIRAAWVAIKFYGSWHACNAFETADKGLVFIDCTGLEANEVGPPNRDKIVDIKLRKDYIARSMFPQPGWAGSWRDMGKVLDVQVYW